MEGWAGEEDGIVVIRSEYVSLCRGIGKGGHNLANDNGIRVITQAFCKIQLMI